jgi:Spy/CpxP family protein refolding chaperone
MNSWKIILATAVIFGCGVVTGGLLVNYVEHAHPEFRRPFAGPRHDRAGAQELQLARPQMLNQQFVEQLDAALHLTPEQREKIGKIIADGQERNRDLWKLVSPQFRGVMQDVRQRIRAMLTPEQKKQFEELMKQFSPRRLTAPTNAPSALPPAAPPDAPPPGT